MIDMEKQFSGYEDSKSDKGFLDNEEGLTDDTTQIPTNFIIDDFVSTPKLAREISALPAILVSDELAWEELIVRFEKKFDRKKIISAKFKRGDFCYIHANSSIVTAYFETFEKNLIAACFEGICTEVKAKWY